MNRNNKVKEPDKQIGENNETKRIETIKPKKHECASIPCQYDLPSSVVKPQ